MILLDIKQNKTLIIKRILIIFIVVILLYLLRLLGVVELLQRPISKIPKVVYPLLGLSNKSNLQDFKTWISITGLFLEFYFLYISVMDVWDFYQKLNKNARHQMIINQLYGKDYLLIVEYITCITRFLIVWSVYKTIFYFLSGHQNSYFVVICLGVSFYLAVIAISLLSTVIMTRVRISSEYIVIIITIFFLLGNVYKIFPLIKMAIIYKGGVADKIWDSLTEKFQVLHHYSLISYQNPLIVRDGRFVLIFMMVCLLTIMFSLAASIFVNRKKGVI